MSVILGKIRDRVVASAIVRLASVAPRGAERALPRYLDCVPPLTALSTVLRRSGVESITVRGEQGIFTGSAADAAVIQRYALERKWSAETLATIRDFFTSRGAGTYIDVGANIGLTTVPIAAAGIDVIAFEPATQNHDYLLHNIAANGVGHRIHVEKMALMERAGEVVMELSPANHGDHRIRRSTAVALMRENSWATTTVPARRLDDYFDRITPPVVLKIDTQGAEPFVLAGGPRIGGLTELAILEFSPYNMNRMQSDSAVIADYLRLFAHIAIYEAEGDRPSVELAGSEAAAYLRDYEAKFRTVPKGRYLNIVARR